MHTARRDSLSRNVLSVQRYTCGSPVVLNFAETVYAPALCLMIRTSVTLASLATKSEQGNLETKLFRSANKIMHPTAYLRAAAVFCLPAVCGRSGVVGTFLIPLTSKEKERERRERERERTS